MRRNTQYSLIVFTIALMLGSSIDANAQNRLRGMFSRNQRGQQARVNRGQQQGFKQRLNQFVQTNRLKTFTKNGKPVIAMKNKTQVNNQYLKLGKNVIEFFVRPGFHHLYMRVPYPGQDGKVQHKVFSRISGLDVSSWYGSTSERVSVLAELSDKQLTNLRKYLDKAKANPLQVLGRFEYNGGRPPHASNCTSYVTNAKIGENGETLARVLGVYESGMPQGFLNSLMSRGNSQVKAMVVTNPSGSEFSANGYDLGHALR